MKRSPKTAQVNLRLSPELKKAAEQAAVEDNRSLTSLIEKLIEDHLRETGRAIGKTGAQDEVGGTQMPDYDPMDVAQWFEAWFISHVTPGTPMSDDQEEAMLDALYERFPGLSEEMVCGDALKMFEALLQRYSATKH